MNEKLTEKELNDEIASLEQVGRSEWIEYDRENFLEILKELRSLRAEKKALGDAMLEARLASMREASGQKGFP